jgi:hypothetical protein
MKTKLIKKKITININATFGSEWQDDVALNALKVLLKGWTSFYRTTHKKNYIKFDIKQDEN